jgi:hypothetical protein
MRTRDSGLAFSTVALAALMGLSAQATPLQTRTKAYFYRSKKLAVVARAPFALRACSGFVNHPDACVHHALSLQLRRRDSREFAR